MAEIFRCLVPAISGPLTGIGRSPVPPYRPGSLLAALARPESRLAGAEKRGVWGVSPTAASS